MTRAIDAPITIGPLRRSWFPITFLALAVLVATASADPARPGWEVRRAVSGGSLVGSNTAKHCGAGRFGMYTIHGRERYNRGTLRGQTVRVVVTVDLLDDRRRHRFHFVSVAGTSVTRLRPALRRKLERALAVEYAKYSIEVLPFRDALRLKTRLWFDGKVVSTGYLRLRKARC